jgi:hypothetical protein
MIIARESNCDIQYSFIMIRTQQLSVCTVSNLAQGLFCKTAIGGVQVNMRGENDSFISGISIGIVCVLLLLRVVRCLPYN